jgi:cell division protein FtsI (penicillin-binding protein 3)
VRNPTNRRLRLIGAAFLLALLGIGAQAYKLQVLEHAHLSRLSQEQYLAHVKIPARRGHIVDQSGAPLAITVDVPSVFANPSAISDVALTATTLAPILGMSPEALAQRLGGGRYFVWLKRHVPQAVGDSVRALRLTGVGVTQEPRRAYPNKEVAAHVIGVAGLDGRGLEGIEKQLDHELLGAPQMVRALRDARGRSVLAGGAQSDVKARGAEVTLSLDVQVQHMAEQALAQAVASTGA